MALRVTVGDRCESCLEVGEGFDAVDLAGFDQRGNARSGVTVFVIARKQCILAIAGSDPPEFCIS